KQTAPASPSPAKPTPSASQAPPAQPQASSSHAAPAKPGPKPETKSKPELKPKRTRARSHSQLQKLQRDLDGPGSDVAMALNRAFGSNAREEEDESSDDSSDDSSEEEEPQQRRKEKAKAKSKEIIDVDALSTHPPLPPPGPSLSRSASASAPLPSASRPSGSKPTSKHPTPSSVTPTPGTLTPTLSHIPMSSLRNKNKKKGFRLSMAQPIPRKIVFDERGDALVDGLEGGGQDTQMDVDNEQDDAATQDQAEEPSLPTLTLPSFSQSSQPTQSKRPRLIPPSEIQSLGELPPRVFVTSVDVEEGMWGDVSGGANAYGAEGGVDGDGAKKRGKGKNKKKRKALDQDQDVGGDAYDYSYGNGNMNGRQDSPSAVEDALVLPYDDVEEPLPTSNLGSKSKSQHNGKINVDPKRNPEKEKVRNIDWTKAEKVWEKSKEVGSVMDLSVLVLAGGGRGGSGERGGGGGVVVGWKPPTFSGLCCSSPRSALSFLQ
ncbi:hypothetical protein CVT26_015965, partial [Gymnopilus dilepis]